MSLADRRAEVKNFKNKKKKANGNIEKENQDGEEDLPRVIAFDEDSSENEEQKSFNEALNDREQMVPSNTFSAKKHSLQLNLNNSLNAENITPRKDYEAIIAPSSKLQEARNAR